MLKIDADRHGRPTNDGAGTAFAAGTAELGELQALPLLHRTKVSQQMTGMGHVWTAPSWQGLSLRMQHWSVHPCVRPLSAVHMTAGHNALRGSGPDQKPAKTDIGGVFMSRRSSPLSASTVDSPSFSRCRRGAAARRPFPHAVRPPRAGLVEVRGVRQHVLARHGQLGARTLNPASRGSPRPLRGGG